MKLTEYRKKRQFAVTPEPHGSDDDCHGDGPLLYAIQKHMASRLHYDLRLQWSGVLLSWAIPKGPSLDPAVKRLAMRTEDHPVEYGNFEGVIPAGQYGAGTVMLWDRGTWQPEDTDVDASLQRGEIRFTLEGKKLQGSWVLVRTRSFGKDAWLLIKHRDQYASSKDVTQQEPRSVASGRLLAEIARDSGGNIARASQGDPSATQRIPTSAKLPIAVSHPDKIFWPDEGYTKLDLVEYYNAIFPHLAPYVKDRILSLERCPDGMQGECFFQKQKPKGMPPGTPTKRIAHADNPAESTEYVVGGSLVTELALANLGCIAVHTMASRATSPRQPDWVCFDLDPESGNFSDAARAGLHIKDALDQMKLVSFAKTSGSRGMHVLVPIRTGPDADEVLAFAESFVARVAAAHPDELTIEHSVAARRGRVYLDPFRNGFAQTVVAPYSVRRRAKAPISTPLDWPEVRPTLVPSGFNLGNFAQRLKRADPWSDFFHSRQSLKDAARLLSKL
jgi:bifunctional non-homologous end joining protein LigD